MADAEWKYKLTPDDTEKKFYLKGVWNIDFDYEDKFEGGFYTQAELVNYTITYELGSLSGVTNAENPTTYTVESEIDLKAPQVPDGYVFKGWYKSFEDGVYGDKVETLSGSYGNITLFANIAEGYKISVTIDNETPTYYEVDSDNRNFTLPDTPVVYGKEFSG